MVMTRIKKRPNNQFLSALALLPDKA